MSGKLPRKIEIKPKLSELKPKAVAMSGKIPRKTEIKPKLSELKPKSLTRSGNISRKTEIKPKIYETNPKGHIRNMSEIDLFGVKRTNKLRTPSILPHSRAPTVWTGHCPYINLSNQEEGEFNMKEFLGKPVILFFNLSQQHKVNIGANYEEIFKVQMVFISNDSIEDQKKELSNKMGSHSHSHIIVADETGKISKRFGVFQKKENKALSSLFVVGPDGFVRGARIWGDGIVLGVKEVDAIVTSYLEEARGASKGTKKSGRGNAKIIRK